VDSLFDAAEGSEGWEDRLEELARQVAVCSALSNVMFPRARPNSVGYAGYRSLLTRKVQVSRDLPPSTPSRPRSTSPHAAALILRTASSAHSRPVSAPTK
jgi:hypothetical protein